MLGAVSIFHPDQPVVFTHENTHVCSVKMRMQGLWDHNSVNLQKPFSHSFPSGLAECVYTPVMSVSNGLPFPEANAIITSQHVLNRLNSMEWWNRVTLRAVFQSNENLRKIINKDTLI